MLRTATLRTRTVTAWRASSKPTIKALRRFSCMDPPTSLLSSITWRGMSANTHCRGGTHVLCVRVNLQNAYRCRNKSSERWVLCERGRTNEERKADRRLLRGGQPGTRSTGYLMWGRLDGGQMGFLLDATHHGLVPQKDSEVKEFSAIDPFRF